MNTCNICERKPAKWHIQITPMSIVDCTEAITVNIAVQVCDDCLPFEKQQFKWITTTETILMPVHKKKEKND